MMKSAPLLIGLALFSALPDAHAFPQPADSTHFCVPFDYEQWRRDNPRPAAKRLSDLNVGEPRTVRMIYFLPNDWSYRADVVDSMKTAIRQVQNFYSGQMKAHGYGAMPFRFETDSQGEPLVHRVDGRHPDHHYYWETILEEIEGIFDLQRNIYFAVIDNRSDGIWNAGGESSGIAFSRGKNGGMVLLTHAFGFNVAAHELGHAFGLRHDFRDSENIMSYGDLPDPSLSECNARFLAVHPYFNPTIPIEPGTPPAVELLSPTQYPHGSTSVTVQLKLTGTKKLHHVLVFADIGSSDHEVWDCRNLTQKEEIVEFEYDGSSPYSGRSGLFDQSEYGLIAAVVDTEGDVTYERIVLSEDSPYLIATMQAHGEGALQVAFSPDGKILASVSSSISGGDHEVILWDVATQAQVGILAGHTDAVSTVAFSPDGKMLASGSHDGTVRLWDVAARTEISTLKGHTDWVGPVAFSPDGKTLASSDGVETDASGAKVVLWDVEAQAQVGALSGHALFVSALAFSPDGKSLASGAGDGTARLWDVETRELVASLEGGHTREVNELVFSPDGASLSSASSGGTIIRWDLETRTPISTIEEVNEWIFTMALSPDGSMLAYQSGARVKLLNMATETEIAVLSHPSSLRSVVFSPDGTTLASGVWDGRILLWDLSEWTGPRPSALEIISGDGQQGAPEALLAQPLVVEVRNQYGDPLPNAPVTYTITAGDGKLSERFWVVHTTTNVDGRAETTLTLGPQPGMNVVGVSIGRRELARFHAEGVGTAVAELEGDFRTWHLPDGATVRLGKGALGNGDRAVALSADGRCLAVASGIGVWLYEAATSRALALLPTESPVHTVSLSMNGTLAAGLENREVELWKMETGDRIGTLRHGGGSSGVTVVFSSDGTTLASSSVEQIIKLWDVETKRQVGGWELGEESHFYFDTPVAFSPDGSRLAAGIRDGTVRLWEVATQTQIVVLEGHRDQVASVVFSSDGAFLASAGGWEDRTVKLWDAATQTEVATLRGHTNAVNAVSFSPDGSLLASGSWDGTIRLWDEGNRTLLRTLEEHTGSVHSVLFSPDGAILVSAAADGTVLLREMETGNAAAVSGHNSSSAMALSPDGSLLASVGGWNGDHTVKLWDAATQTEVATLRGHTNAVNAVSFSPDGALLASGSWDGTIRLWDVSTRSQVAILKEHSSISGNAVSFSPDGGLLASGSRDGTIGLWDVGTREQIELLDGHTDDVLSVAFSPDGAILASAGNWEGTVKLWNMATKELVATLEGHDRAVNAVAFSPDGNTLASCSELGIRIWDVATRAHIGTLEESGGWNPAESIGFSPDGTMLVSGSLLAVKVWDLATEQPVSTLEGHNSWVHSVAFAPDGTFVSGSDDGTMLLWDLRPRPHTLIKVAGDKQQGPAGAALSNPFVVWVRDQNGDLFAGAAVTFAVTAGDGTLSETTVTTDANGRVATTLTLGSQAGPNTVEVTADDLEPVVFTATGQAVPQTLAKVSGEGLEGPAGAALSSPFVVSVLDQSGNAFEGARVTFAVTAGDGTLSISTATTDAKGQASATLTLGRLPATNTVKVTVEGLEPVTFTAVGQAVPQTLAKVSGDEQQGPPGVALATPFVVSVLDQNGAAFAGGAVTFAVTAGEGTLSATTATTDAEGRAAVTLTLGSAPGTQTVEATVAGLEPVIFTAVAEATPDFDGDGETGFSDFFLFAEAFGGSDPRFDLDGDGSVGFADFFLLSDHFADPARGKLLALARELIGLPDGPQLRQNAPNPFNSDTVITWFLLRPGPARVEVFSLTGQRVAVLQEGPEKAGFHRVHWDGRDDRARPLASGVYLYRLVTDGSVQTRKLTLLR